MWEAHFGNGLDGGSASGLPNEQRGGASPRRLSPPSATQALSQKPKVTLAL